MAKIFHLPPRKDEKPHKGEHIINNRYRFVDGQLNVSEDIANRIAPVLTRFYGCRIEDAPVAAKDETKKNEASLSADQTKK